MKKPTVKTQQAIVIVATVVLGAIVVVLANDTSRQALQTPAVKAQVQQKPVVDPAPTVNELLTETNKARTDNGLQPLVLDERLNVTAQAKCQDMLEKNYWSHDTPDGTKPWAGITEHEIYYQTAGENLGYGYKTAIQQVDGWMKSPGHRANILKAEFTNVGFGICKIDREYQDRNANGNDYIIVQHFILPA